MNVERVTLHNFGSWREFDWSIERGVTLLSGHNGAGKSTAIDGMLFGMYGATSDAGRLVHRGTDAGSVELEIALDDGAVLYLERAIYLSGGRSRVTLSLGVREPGAEHAEGRTAATVTETQAILDGLLGVSREVLLASAFSTQHGGGAFTEAAPRDRKRILTETLPGLAIWQPLADQARAEQKAAQAAATVARSQVEQLDGAVERQREARDRLEYATLALVDAEAAETRADSAATRLAAEAEAAREARRQHAAAVEAAERARADHERASTERAAADEALARAKDAAANAPSVETAIVALEAAMDTLGEAQEQHEFASEAARKHADTLARARRELADLQSERDTGDCARCGQPLRADVTDRLAEMTRTFRALEKTAPPPPDDVALATARTAAQQAQTRFAEAQTILALAGSIDDAYSRTTAAIMRQMETEEALRVATTTAIEAESTWLLPQNQNADLTHQCAAATLAGARAEHSAASAELARAEEAAKQAERDATRESHARDTLAIAEHEAAIAGILAAGFGPQGVPAMIVDGILGQLADETNRVLAELGTPIRVDLRSQRVTKDNRLIDALEIIAILDGLEAPYETLSGGERTRLALALRAALTRLLASKRGARVRLLVVDEPAGLDSTGCEQLASVLEEFVTAGVFETIILVTHQAELAEQITRVVRVEKTPSGESRLVESAGSPQPAELHGRGSSPDNGVVPVVRTRDESTVGGAS